MIALSYNNRYNKYRTPLARIYMYFGQTKLKINQSLAFPYPANNATIKIYTWPQHNGQ